mmetsp:Transcript_41419/g.74294  ORF Transcript_41419/g.74294 Transcript_41419/m.74294 type:complete len:97 (-) Transcript_41419:22-312(-)
MRWGCPKAVQVSLGSVEGFSHQSEARKAVDNGNCYWHLANAHANAWRTPVWRTSSEADGGGTSRQQAGEGAACTSLPVPGSHSLVCIGPPANDRNG